MTVTTTANSISYAGNGTTKAFAFPYIFFAPSDLAVTLIVTATDVNVSPPPLLNGAATYDYTVTGVVTDGEYASGGTVTFNTAPITGYTVSLVRAVPATQLVTLIDNTKFPATTINTEFDKLTVLAQQTASFGGGLPAGPAGGDLSGTYPSPTIRTDVALAGNPTAPTPAPGDNDTSIATTAFVAAAVAGGGGTIIREVTLSSPAATIDLFSLGVKSVQVLFHLKPDTDNVVCMMRAANGTTVDASSTYGTITMYNGNTTPATVSGQFTSNTYCNLAASVSNTFFLTGTLTFPDLATGRATGAHSYYTSSSLIFYNFQNSYTCVPGNGLQFLFNVGNLAAGSFVRVIGWP